MKNKLALLLFLAVFSLNVCFANTNRIIAVVNKTPITTFDLNQTRDTLALLYGIEETNAQISKQLYAKAQEVIIMQNLLKYEAKKLQISISKDELANQISQIEKSKHLPNGFFKGLFKENGIDYQYFENKILTETIIQKLQQNFVSLNQVNNDDINQLAINNLFKPAKFLLKTFSTDGSKDYKQFISLRKKVKSCTAIPKLDKKFKYSEIETEINKLPPMVKISVQNLAVNETSSILKTDEGFEFFLVCNKQVENLSEQEIAALADSILGNKVNAEMQRFYANIKRNAYIKIYE